MFQSVEMVDWFFPAPDPIKIFCNVLKNNLKLETDQKNPLKQITDSSRGHSRLDQLDLHF